MAWVRRQIGEHAASKVASSRTAPKALFACEVHRDKALGKQLETQGTKLMRIAMGIGPREGQMAPPDLCLYANKAWVPWSMECSLRKDRLHKSLKASGTTTWPGIVYAKGSKRVGKPTVVFPRKAPPGSNSEKATKWVAKRKREEVSKMSKAIKQSSVRELEWVISGCMLTEAKPHVSSCHTTLGDGGQDSLRSLKLRLGGCTPSTCSVLCVARRGRRRLQCITS